jgi:hypothetical protein
MDRGHPEGELNYRCCLRLLGRWDLLRRSPPPTCTPPSDDCLAVLFLDCLKDSEAEYHESVVDDGHPESESNYRHCLRLPRNCLGSFVYSSDFLTISVTHRTHPVSRVFRVRKSNWLESRGLLSSSSSTGLQSQSVPTRAHMLGFKGSESLTS